MDYYYRYLKQLLQDALHERDNARKELDRVSKYNVYIRECRNQLQIDLNFLKQQVASFQRANNNLCGQKRELITERDRLLQSIKSHDTFFPPTDKACLESRVAALRRNVADLYKVITEQTKKILKLKECKEEAKVSWGEYYILHAAFVAEQKLSLDRRDEIDRMNKQIGSLTRQVVFLNAALTRHSARVMEADRLEVELEDAHRRLTRFADKINDRNHVIGDLRRDIKELHEKLHQRFQNTHVGKVIDEQEKEIVELIDLNQMYAMESKKQEKEIAELKDKLRLEEVAADVDFKQQGKEIAELRAKAKWLQALGPWTHLTAQ